MTESKSGRATPEYAEWVKVADQGENGDHTDVTETDEDTIVEVIENGIQGEKEGFKGESGEESELEGIVEGDAGEEEFHEWENVVEIEQNIEIDHEPQEEDGIDNDKELVDEGAEETYDEKSSETDTFGDIGWVEELWKKKKDEEALGLNNAEEREKELGKCSSRMRGKCLLRMSDLSQTVQTQGENQPKTSRIGGTITAQQDHSEAGRTRSVDAPNKEIQEHSSDSLIKFTKRRSCIPPAYFGPAFDENFFQCCIRICPVDYSDLVCEDFATVLARADCVRMKLESKTCNTPRLLEIYCQRSAPLLYNLMFCPYSSSTVTIELIRKKPSGWKTVLMKDKVMKVPSVYSTQECTRAKFKLKTAYFRHNLGKIINVNACQHVKKRLLFIKNIPATVDQNIVKHIFPLAAKITWVNDSENLRSAVLMMNSRKMVLNHMVAMTDITLNGQEVKIAADGMSQKDAQRMHAELLKKCYVQRQNSSKPSKIEKKKNSIEAGNSKASLENLNIKTDVAYSSKKTQPGLSQKPTPNELKKRKWMKKKGEKYLRAAREMRLEREKKDNNLENMQRVHRKGSPKLQKQRLGRGRSNQQGSGEKKSVEMQYELKIQLKIERQREIALHRDREMKMEIEEQREREIQNEIDMQWEREMQHERRLLRERELEKQKVEQQREWQEKEQWEWEERKQWKMEKHIHQEEDHECEWRNQEELLRQKERLERINQEAMHTLHLVEEQQRWEREKFQRREREMAAEKACMQQQLEEERWHQQKEREEWEHASASRKRNRHEEQGDWEQEMAGGKRGRGNDRPLDDFFEPLSISAIKTLEMEVVRQTEELKSNLALLDKLQKDDSIILSKTKRDNSVQKDHGGHHHLGPFPALERCQKADYQQGYSRDFQLQHHQPYSQDYSTEFKDCGENQALYGLGIDTGGMGDYNTEALTNRQESSSASWGAGAGHMNVEGASSYGSQSYRQVQGEEIYQHTGGTQYRGGRGFAIQGRGAKEQGAFNQAEPQTREGSGYQQGRRDNYPIGRDGYNYDQAGRRRGGSDFDQVGRQIGYGDINNRERRDLQKGRVWGQRQERWCGSSGGHGRRENYY